MSNPYYTNSQTILPLSRARASDVETKFDVVEAGFDAVKTDMDAKASTTALTAGLAGKENTGVAAGLVAAHEAAGDPHPQYTTAAEAAAAAPVQSVAGKTGAVTVTKADVGLGNADNTADLAKPISTATQTALDAKAPLNSPALTGTPTAPTASAGTSTDQLATTAFVMNQAFSTSLPGQTGNAGKYLQTDGTTATWQEVAAGDVDGPASAVDGAVVLFDGATGKLLKDSGVALSSKQDTLVSGTNIKTVGGQSLLGAGNISVGTGDVVGPASSVDNQIVLFNGTTGKLVKTTAGSGLVKIASGAVSTAVAGTDFQAAITATGVLKGAGTGSVSTAVAGTDYVTPAGAETLTNKTLSTGSTWSGNTIALDSGGTGAALTDPNADRIMFWDDSAGAVTWLTASTGLSISGTTLTATNNGDVVGPASAVSGQLASFSGTTGKLIADSGKATPTGAIVGTTDSQTLTNKTLVAPVNLASTTATQDGVIVTGRAGGASSFRVTIAPTTLTASRAVTLPDAAGVAVLDAASQTLTNKTLTSPRVGTSLLDTNGNELFNFTATASAVNELTYANAAAGGSPTFTASGSSTDISINFVPKGAGTLQANGIEVVTLTGAQTLESKVLKTCTINGTGTTLAQIGYSGGNLTIGNGSTSSTVANQADIGVANSSLVKTAINASGSAPIFACRAWAYVTYSGGVPTLVNNGNVSSVTDTATGDLKLNFTTALPNATYSVVVSADSSANTFADLNNGSRTTSQCGIFVRTANTGALTDAGAVTAAVFC